MTEKTGGHCECCGVYLPPFGLTFSGKPIDLRTDICPSCLDYKTRAERYKKQKEMYGEIPTGNAKD